jgi:hypothetical protein
MHGKWTLNHRQRAVSDAIYRCRHECSSHPDVINVMSKISEVTGIPFENSESFQVCCCNHYVFDSGKS